MKTIPLTQNKESLVDDSDYDYLSQFKWCAILNRGKWYAARKDPTKKNRIVFMHRFMTDCPRDLEVDHINGDGLDNRRSNIRLCTHAQNIMNSTPRGGSSKYKGVCWNKRNKKWGASIRYKNKQYNLGSFNDEVEAAKAYDKACLQFHGEFANPNFPREACA